MKRIIENYKNGDMFAEDKLIEEILELHHYNINREEAKFLLHKKYGKQEIF